MKEITWIKKEVPEYKRGTIDGLFTERECKIEDIKFLFDEKNELCGISIKYLDQWEYLIGTGYRVRYDLASDEWIKDRCII